MAILWLESFDYYGADETKMLDGLWAELSSAGGSPPVVMSNAFSRTGAYSLFFGAGSGVGALHTARRVFGGAKVTVGVGGAYYLDSLPDQNDILCILRLNDAANAEQISFYVQSTGIIACKRGATLLGSTATPAITAAAWNHIEFKAVINNSTGAVEIRVNEVTVLNLTGVDTQATANVETSQMLMGKFNGGVAQSADWYVDDLFTWDDATVGDNDVVDFIGDKKVFTVFPDADTAEADWAKSSGVTGYTLIDESSPNDADYISTATDGDVSEFGLANLPANVAEIIALQLTPRVLKTDAGSVLFAADVVSGASATAATEIPITTQATYWPFIHTKDPASSAPFTLSEFNAAKLRVARPAP